MAEKNTKKLTPFEQEQIDVAKKILEFKLSAEANVVSILYKKPDEINNVNLTLDNFSNNIWKVYYQIAYDIIIVEQKSTLDDITVGMYLEKHPKIKAKYNEYGGYNTIQSAIKYINVENLDGYILELNKWGAVLKLCKSGFPISNRLSDYVDMSSEEIYSELETYLNHTFINVDSEIKTYNVFDGMHDFVRELNEQENIGLPFYNAPLLTNEVGGFDYRGNIYSLGASSGCGKSTMAFNYLVPSCIENNEKIVFIINEEDEKKFKKELLVWVANNIFKEELHKYKLRDGRFDSDTLDLLSKCADWIEEKKDDKIFTVIPLQHYSASIAIKVINKYSALGVKLFVLDTLKESADAKSDEIYKSMLRDSIALYDCVKPSAKNVGLFMTYQLSKGSVKTRHFTNGDIGQAKSIVDVISVNLMMRRPFQDEYEGCSKELECYKLEGKNKGTKIVFKLSQDKNYMLTFITKNRFGVTDAYQIVSEVDLSTNTYKDIGYTIVPEDF